MDNNATTEERELYDQFSKVVEDNIEKVSYQSMIGTLELLKSVIIESRKLNN